LQVGAGVVGNEGWISIGLRSSTLLVDSMSHKQIIWHDPNVGNAENTAYKNRFEKEGWSVKAMTTVAATVGYLAKSDLVGQFLVLTSGTNGEDLVKQLESNAKVLAIVVFCKKKEYHESWAAKHPKVKSVLSTQGETSKVIKELQDVWYAIDLLCGVDDVAAGAVGYVLAADHQIVSGASISSQAHGANWCPMNKDLAFAFISILKVLRSRPVTPQEVLQDLLPIVSNPAEFQTQWDGPEWVQDSGSKVQPASLGQRMSLGYTSNFFYARMNKMLAESRFNYLRHYLGAFAQEIGKQEVKLQFTGKELFRGVTKNCVDLADYAVDAEFYWPNFLSTAKSDSTPKGFAGSDGFVFVIERNLESIHPHVDIDANPEWGHYGKAEKEVLLMPFLHAKVKRHSKQGSLMYIYVLELPSVYRMTPQQSDAQLRQWIEDRLKPKIMGVFVKDKDSVFRKIEKEIPLGKYFFEPTFQEDYNRHYMLYISQHPADAGFQAGFWNVVKGGQGVRDYVQGLMKSIQDKIPQDIQKRVSHTLKTRVKEGMERINQIITEEVKTADPSIDVHTVLEALSDAFTSMAQTLTSPEARMAEALSKLGLLGMILALLFDPEVFMSMAGDTFTFTQGDIQDRAKQQCWDKLVQALHSGQVRSELWKADSKNLEEFEKILTNQGTDACEAVERALQKVFF